MKKIVYLALILAFISFKSYSQITTNYYCRSNGELFVLPLGSAGDCGTARCMFETYFRTVGRSIDGNLVYCNPVLVTEDYTIIDYPRCGNGSPGALVTIYKDENYGGGQLSYGPGTNIQCMDTTPRNTSFWGGFVDHGQAVRNDEITSLRVPNGLMIICYWDCNYQGESIVYTQDCPNVGPHWNDKISSFKVMYATPSVRKVHH